MALLLNKAIFFTASRWRRDFSCSLNFSPALHQFENPPFTNVLSALILPLVVKRDESLLDQSLDAISTSTAVNRSRFTITTLCSCHIGSWINIVSLSSVCCRPPYQPLLPTSTRSMCLIRLSSVLSANCETWPLLVCKLCDALDLFRCIWETMCEGDSSLWSTYDALIKFTERPQKWLRASCWTASMRCTGVIMLCTWLSLLLSMQMKQKMHVMQIPTPHISCP